MTKEEALKIVAWVTEPPQSIADYSKSYSNLQVVEAFGMAKQPLPEWIQVIQEYQKLDSNTQKFAETLARNQAEALDKIIIGCLNEINCEQREQNERSE